MGSSAVESYTETAGGVGHKPEFSHPSDRSVLFQVIAVDMKTAGAVGYQVQSYVFILLDLDSLGRELAARKIYCHNRFLGGSV